MNPTPQLPQLLAPWSPDTPRRSLWRWFYAELLECYYDERDAAALGFRRLECDPAAMGALYAIAYGVHRLQLQDAAARRALDEAEFIVASSY